MKLHYRSKCAHGHKETVRLDKPNPGFDRLIENYIRELFDEREISDAQREKLWKRYYQKLSKGLDTGYSPKLKHYDAELGAALKKNIAEFSAFKETSFRKDLEAQLTENGKFLPWSKFREKAYAVSGNYNKRWLETEYHHTVANANMAKKWKRFERNQDLYPNLKYQAVNDGRTRNKHRGWDGTILPVDHPWWDTHLPPNDWGCRCDAIQTDDPVSAEVPEGRVKQGFANNPAKSGEVFSEIAYANGLSGKEIEQAGVNALAWMAKNSKGKVGHYAENLFYRLPLNQQFKTVQTFKSGSVKIHRFADFDNDYDEVLDVCRGFAKKGGDAFMLPKLEADNLSRVMFYKKLGALPYPRKNPDVFYNEKLYEVEGYKSKKKALSKMMSRGLKQASRIVIKDEGSTAHHIRKIIKFRVNYENQKIDEVWVIYTNGELERVY